MMLAPTMRSAKSSWDDLGLNFAGSDHHAGNLELWLEENETQEAMGLKSNHPTPITAPALKASGPRDWAPPLTSSKTHPHAPECVCTAPLPVLQHHYCPSSDSTPQSIASQCPMAFWSVQTRKLLAFNDAFVRMMQLPVDMLQKAGVRWDSFADSFQCDTTDRTEVDESYTRLKHTAFAISSGVSEYNQQHYTFLSAVGTIKSVEITMLLVGTEMLWIIQETPSRRASIATSAPSSVRSSPMQSRRGSMGGSPLSTEGEDNDNYSDTEGAVGGGRQKKKHPRFKPKPWDDNITKFSLPKQQKSARKRSRVSNQ